MAGSLLLSGLKKRQAVLPTIDFNWSLKRLTDAHIRGTNTAQSISQQVLQSALYKSAEC